MMRGGISLDKEFLYEIFRREMRERKIPLSLGKTCSVKCTFCYEKDHSYRKTFDTPLTTQEHWNFILKEIQSYPTRDKENWVIGGNEYMEWTDLFLHPPGDGLVGRIFGCDRQKYHPIYRGLHPARPDQSPGGKVSR